MKLYNMYHFHTSDQRVQPVHAYITYCWNVNEIYTLLPVQYIALVAVHISRYTIPKSPKNYQIPLMQPFAVCFFI